MPYNDLLDVQPRYKYSEDLADSRIRIQLRVIGLLCPVT